MDSNFYFKNLSDSGDNITYKWDFGDGIISTIKNPSHSYSNTGKYKVKLIVNVENIGVDTSETELTVLLGQKEISLDTLNTEATDIVETNNGYLLLCSKNYTSFLMTLDHNLKQKETRALPAKMFLSFIAPCNDGNYIFIGTTSGGNFNELIKMKADGTLIWSKLFNADNFASIQQTPDNGFILVGMRYTVGINNTKIPQSVIIKTNETGDTIWENFFTGDNILQHTANAIIASDGYTIAGIKHDNTKGFFCSDCDSVCILKLNNQGLVKWRKATNSGINSQYLTFLSIAKLPNNNYNIISVGDLGSYFFSETGEFISRKILPNVAVYNSVTTDGSLMILEKESGNGFRAVVEGYTTTGALSWNVGINAAQKRAGFNSCCADSWPVVVKPLKNGGAIFVSNKIDLQNYHEIATFIKIDKDGKVL
ncbi:PKD domain-containing protein [Mucilaginibacter sp. UR6-11]|uniref:PKD domain-containing protein n=1 Tax=Mucilaginibacter sp. UR6-11 TaxID=1435644 RepID=UPI001E57DA86|nr:PKD domain-containing protein [Mucilaginibacter sp. UR6-11]MCC8424034.1 PKD domain-containing protein [Mucilaginibacter sp. UR6-11]